ISCFTTRISLLPHLSSSFFFCCSGHHPYLHSFPTRRSSDLYLNLPIYRNSGLHNLRNKNPLLLLKYNRLYSRFPYSVFRQPPSRSEEHTSELQSRENLVCRLLLEKKKKERTTPKTS